MFKKNGFTLVELLIIIGILGILVIALVLIVDPFEQVKRSQDAIVKNAAVEITSANIRYYTTHGRMPWIASATCLNEIGQVNTLNNTPTCVNELINDGELKAGFLNAEGVLNKIYISTCGSTPIVCFNPLSTAQNHDSNTKYDQFGNIKNGCPVVAGISTECYWCTAISSCTNNTPTPTITPTPTLTPTPTPVKQYIGYCGVRNNHTSLPGTSSNNGLSAPDLAIGYARIKKANIDNIEELRAICALSDYQNLFNSYCTINTSPAYVGEVILYRTDGRFYQSGSSTTASNLFTSCTTNVTPTNIPIPTASSSAN
jgi:Tfp pilus assembly protein PilE